PVRRCAPVTVRRPADGVVFAPATAPGHPDQAPWRVRVFTPLKHVAVHVAQAQLVWWVGAYPRWSLQVLPLRCRVVVGHVVGKVVGRLGEVEVIRTFFFRSSPTPTSVFPFRLTRQSVQESPPFFPLIQLLDERQRVVPRYLLHWEQLQFLVGEVHYGLPA